MFARGGGGGGGGDDAPADPHFTPEPQGYTPTPCRYLQYVCTFGVQYGHEGTVLFQFQRRYKQFLLPFETHFLKTSL